MHGCGPSTEGAWHLPLDMLLKKSTSSSPSSHGLPIALHKGSRVPQIFVLELWSTWIYADLIQISTAAVGSQVTSYLEGKSWQHSSLITLSYIASAFFSNVLWALPFHTALSVQAPECTGVIKMPHLVLSTHSPWFPACWPVMRLSSHVTCHESTLTGAFCRKVLFSPRLRAG